MRITQSITNSLAWLALIFLCSGLANCQDYGDLQFLQQLPKDLREVSGIQRINNSNQLWLVNDSGNPPDIYRWNPETPPGFIPLQVTDLNNIDWEDLATDQDSMLYVGDFGNNMNKRRDLVIYHLKLEGDSLTDLKLVGKTAFQFDKQKDWPPKKKDRKFDVEAFFYKDNNFYLFTRHRGSAFDNGSHIYRLAALTGNQKAIKVGKFKSCKDARDCQITAADYDPIQDRIALLSYNKVWILDSIDWRDMNHYRSTLYRLGHRSQKESITFESGNCLLIADERSRAQGPNLYRYCLKAGTHTK